MPIERSDTRALPPLAWCARLRRAVDVVELHCGDGVELRADGSGCFEGAWDGAFADWAFDSAPNVYGSGLRLDADGATFVTPSHTCERLQWMRLDDDTLLVSNSLCFLLAAGGDALDPRHAGYARTFSQVVDGIERFHAAVPTRGGRRIELVYFRNFHVDADLRVRWLDKRTPEAPGDFAAYERLLTGTVARVAANAADQARRAGRYRLLTSVSSGYDSAACAALARRNGCTLALTLSEGRGAGNDSGESDSGAPVADGIGLQVKAFSRLDYQRDDRHCPEAEFLATGMNGEDVNFLAFEPELGNSVFLTGFHGDKVWDLHTPPNAVLKRGDLSGASLGEFRLRVNFIHLPVPFIGALHHARLHALANAPALAPWSVGGRYDRPLPRRLAEQAGAPRASFGVRKKATTAQMHNHGLDAMSQGTRRELLGFARRLRPSWTSRLRYRADAVALHGEIALYRLLGRARLLRVLPSLKRLLRGTPVHIHGELGPLPILWATERIMAERYAQVTPQRHADAASGVRIALSTSGSAAR